MPTIVTLPGDGIGPEIMRPALELLRTISEDFSFDEHAFGGAAIDLLVLSHADLDHFNGLPSLFDRFPVGRVTLTPYEHEHLVMPDRTRPLDYELFNSAFRGDDNKPRFNRSHSRVTAVLSLY